MPQPWGDDNMAVPPVAGATTGKKGAYDSAKGCLTLDARCETPPHVRKWRKSMYREPGQRVLHPVSNIYV